LAAPPVGTPAIGTIVAGNGYLEVPFSSAPSGVTNYQYSVDGGISWTTRSPVATWSPLTIHGLTNGTSYSVKIRGVNADGAGTASSAVSGTPNSQSQILSSQGFLQGSYVEVGVRSSGAFGSTSNPSTFHQNANVSGCVGFRVDRQKNGWGSTVGASAPFTNIDDGDYFCPGSPYEGWGLKVGDNGATYNDDSRSQIAGSITNLVKGATNQTVDWTASSASNGISVSQTAIVANTGQSLHVDVILTNSTGSSIANVYYLRGFDPDNASGDSAGNANTYLSDNNYTNIRLFQFLNVGIPNY
jgi:hypothetical protein